LEVVTTHDAVLTSGGAWQGDRDLVVKVLDQLGWHKIYHRIKLGPGKAVGFGLWQGKPVFCLPGGPPSNQMAFIQLGLPGLQKLAGYRQVGLAQVRARLAQSVSGQEDWTQFLEGRFENTAEGLLFRPVKLLSRLQTMATTEGLLAIPEGTAQLLAGAIVQVQLLPGFQLTGRWDDE
jgi:molybdopterin molybdotransferase